MTPATSPAIFLDRDGVINRNRADYVKCWEEFEFLPGALQALQRLSWLGWPIVVVSNQSAIGRGIVSRDTVDDIHRRMRLAVEEVGGRIDVVLYCPHRPDENCECRKPNPGLLTHAAQMLNINLERSFMIGDALSDVDAARSAGCRPILVKTGRGLEQAALVEPPYMEGVYVAGDLSEVAAQILRTLNERQIAGMELLDTSRLRGGTPMTPYHIMAELRA
ncbi:MAG: D-glycero-beta-D-manno-heptose 1,7-bisphosphate 7-phosphatase [Chloroflexi bacterium]|nr:D-glycero-beta-D-manno-heptose 1,7-bisphosphate 7-phosphatase [Chloroflexota bacterium]MCL5274944.1 D-glycero-beta-D-manno-heptose 1,7-bisphosphate 7-phosphatase [Chloroflexota bacterium]